MNDGYVDSRGRLWAGTMGMDHVPHRGSLYRLDVDGSVHRMLTDITTSNGIDWSPDDRLMYYVDTGNPRIDVFDFDAGAGAIANRRTFVDIPASAGKPDGLIVDAEGGVWLALWGGSAVHRYLPDGTLDRTVSVPARLTTKPAFGGPALEDLYITSAWIALDDAERRAEPAAGGVFHVRPGIRGRAANRFAG
jgi:sugar lactone lactonase YvrE